MKGLLHAGRYFALDMASTIFFLAVFLITKSIPLSVGLGVALGVGQIGWEFARKRPIDAMQWMSLFLVLASGLATVLTNDPRFVMMKASAIYVIVGVVMLKPGWMNRYLPPIAIEKVPDLAYGFGFVWAGLMFLSALVNAAAASMMSIVAWSAFMSTYAIASKLGLFIVQYGTMRFVGRRRWAAEQTATVAA